MTPLKKHPSLLALPTPEQATPAETGETPPDLLVILKEGRKLDRKLREFKQVRDTLYEELAKTAHAVYGVELQRLYEQMERLIVTDHELKQLEVEVLNELKRVLAKY